jgi:hypothetical protein
VKRLTVAPILCAAFTLALLLVPVFASAQELEPGAYWPLPRGLNIVTIVNSINWGDLAFEPSAPIDEAHATINTTALSFSRAFGLAGRSCNAGVVAPVVAGHVEGLYFGEFAEVDRFGLGDPRFRVAMNLYGAPPMTMQEFASYRAGAILGVGLSAVPPLGEYDSAKLINIGTNRWSFKLETGASYTHDKLFVEAMAGAWFFTDNTDFFGGRAREQDPIVATQIHVTHRFTRSTWLAASGNFFTGGQTTVGGKVNADLQRNSRLGLTFSKGFTGHHVIRASISQGAYTTIGADFTSIAIGYNYVWAS